ncbi:MAG: metalloregulator ArsR/SmtB family transcription factor [Clostridiales bacterium]
MENNARQIADLLKVLANEYRLQILSELMKGPTTVGSLFSQIQGVSQSALSQHLAILRANDILDYEKVGLNVIYSIKDHRVEEIIHVLRKYYSGKEFRKSKWD